MPIFVETAFQFRFWSHYRLARCSSNKGINVNRWLLSQGLGTLVIRDGLRVFNKYGSCLQRNLDIISLHFTKLHCILPIYNTFINENNFFIISVGLLTLCTKKIVTERSSHLGRFWIAAAILNGDFTNQTHRINNEWLRGTGLPDNRKSISPEFLKCSLNQWFFQENPQYIFYSKI